jgi:hypothetical protein
MIRAYGMLGYSIPLFRGKFFIVPMIGVGVNFFNLTANLSSIEFGKWYLRPGASGGLELSVQPLVELQFFVRAEYLFIKLNNTNVSFIIPSAGVMYKF